MSPEKSKQRGPDADRDPRGGLASGARFFGATLRGFRKQRHHELKSSHRPFGHRSRALLRGGGPLSAARCRVRARAGRAVARSAGRGRRASSARQPLAPRGQDRPRLPRLWPAVQRADRRRQRRPGSGARQVRSRPRLSLRHLRDVVDSCGDPGIRAAQPLAGQDGHHRGAEEAVLQSAPHEEPSRRAQRGRPAARGRPRHRRGSRGDRGGGGRDEPPPRRDGSLPRDARCPGTATANGRTRWSPRTRIRRARSPRPAS